MSNTRIAKASPHHLSVPVRPPSDKLRKKLNVFYSCSLWVRTEDCLWGKACKGRNQLILVQRRCKQQRPFEMRKLGQLRLNILYELKTIWLKTGATRKLQFNIVSHYGCGPDNTVVTMAICNL